MFNSIRSFWLLFHMSDFTALRSILIVSLNRFSFLDRYNPLSAAVSLCACRAVEVVTSWVLCLGNWASDWLNTENCLNTVFENLWLITPCGSSHDITDQPCFIMSAFFLIECHLHSHLSSSLSCPVTLASAGLQSSRAALHTFLWLILRPSHHIYSCKLMSRTVSVWLC